MKKKHLVLLLAAVLAVGCVGPANKSSFESVEQEIVSNTEFENFLDQYVVKYFEDEYFLCHVNFVHPENYGIDPNKQPKTLPNLFVSDEQKQFAKQVVENLEAMDPRDLNTTNQQIREELLHQYKNQIELFDERFDYLSNIFTADFGVQTIPVTIFSAYTMYQESDIANVVSMIESTDQFIDEALEYANEQAKQNKFAINYDSVMATINSVLESKENCVIVTDLMAEIDNLNLEATKAENYKTQVRNTLNTHLFPAYEKLKAGLEKLKDQNQGVQSIASFPNGKDYYELILKQYAGTADSIDAIKEDVRSSLDEVTRDYRAFLRDDIDVSPDDEKVTNFESPEAIIEFLMERYPAQFPLVSKIKYNVLPASAEQSTDSVQAYMEETPFDSNNPYQIRYNANKMSTDFQTLEFYKVMAHESVPGHVYHEQYNKEHFKHPAQYILNEQAFTEGYATYAAYETLDWSGVDESTCELFKLMDMYSGYAILLMDLQINYDGYSIQEFNNVWGELNEGLYYQIAENPGLFFSYYYGALRIYQLQDIAKEALGDTYNPVRFNDALLQAGRVNFEIVEQNIQTYIDSIRKESPEASEDKTVSSSSNDALNNLNSDQQFEEVE